MAVNNFDGAARHRLEEVRRALALDGAIPLVSCDARRRGSCRDALVTLVEHAISRVGAEDVTAAG